MPSKRMHCEDILLSDLGEIKKTEDRLCEMLKRWKDGYSTSRHLAIIYEICSGLRAKNVGEIGVGRSSFVLYEYCIRNNARYTCCDRYDYRYLFEKIGFDPEYIVGYSDKFYKAVVGMDFLFLDYMSTRKMSARDCYREMKTAFKLMKENAIIAIHDAQSDKYNVGRALELIKQKYGKKIDVLTLPFGYGLGLIRKKMYTKYGKIKIIEKKRTE